MTQTIVGTVAFVVLVLTVASSAAAVKRQRGRHRVDILLLLLGLMAAVWLPRFVPSYGQMLGLGLFVLQPFLTVRLLAHFRQVSPVVWGLIVVGCVLCLAAVGLFGRERYSDAYLVVTIYRVITLFYAAAAFAQEARTLAGATRRRTSLAALGTGMYVATGAVGIYGTLSGEDVPGLLNQIQMAFALTAYYLAFATPRFLSHRWQEREQARYLADAADRDPEERSAWAARDLNAAAARTVGSAQSLVALETAPGADTLRVEAATDASLVGRLIPAKDRLLSRVWRTGFADSAPVREVEPELTSALVRSGIRVLAAPVAASAHSWGVVVALQTRGSLFPEDDLRLLRHFGRYAATALDHGALVADARARARRAADQRLREVESRMALMLDSIKDYALCVVDTRGRVVNWHVGAFQVFGYTSAEMDDEPLAPALTMIERDFEALLVEARLLGHATREGPCLRKDGGRFVGLTTIRPLEGVVEDVDGFVAVTRDVTEQRDLEARFRQSQKMEAIGLLAGGIAHDFNNLLTSIGGQCSWLEREVPEGDPRRAYVEAIQTASDRAAALTSQLLAFSRRQGLQSFVFNLTRLVADMLPMLGRVLGERIEIASELPAQTALVRGDRSQLEQVILNLSVNARDAMPRGGRLSFAIRVGWADERVTGGDARPGPHVQLIVTDTGIGMDTDTVGRIFDPFFTTKPLGRGTGLGLSTVYGIVMQMSGFIRVTSEMGRGATFRLYFPEAPADPAPEPEVRDLFQALRGSETVLVAEDDAGVRKFVGGTLERFGYQVLEAANMTEALGLADAWPDRIDVLVTDVVMPNGTGPELARALAGRRPAMVVLYMSGYADPVFAQETTAIKASHFLQKPFTPTDLLARIRRLLAPPT